MRRFILAAMPALLALMSSHSPASAEPRPIGESAPASDVPFVPGEAPSKAFMVGIWGEGDQCDDALDFQADGTLKDGPFPRWELVDGMLGFDGTKLAVKLTVVDAKTMKSLFEGDKPRTLKRCDAARARDAARP